MRIVIGCVLVMLLAGCGGTTATDVPALTTTPLPYPTGTAMATSFRMVTPTLPASTPTPIPSAVTILVTPTTASAQVVTVQGSDRVNVRASAAPTAAVLAASRATDAAMPTNAPMPIASTNAPTPTESLTYADINPYDLVNHPEKFVGQRVHLVGTLSGVSQGMPTAYGPSWFGLHVRTPPNKGLSNISVTYPKVLPFSGGCNLQGQCDIIAVEVFGVVDMLRVGNTSITYTLIVHADKLKYGDVRP